MNQRTDTHASGARLVVLVPYLWLAAFFSARVDPTGSAIPVARVADMRSKNKTRVNGNVIEQQALEGATDHEKLLLGRIATGELRPRALTDRVIALVRQRFAPA